MTKPVTEFSARKRSKDGLREACKDCEKQYHWNNRERNLSRFRAYAVSVRGVTSQLRRRLGYPTPDAEALAPRLVDDETRCEICGMPSWLVKLNYKKGGPFFLGNSQHHARLHADRLDTKKPHTMCNSRILCPTCNLKRGAERHTDEEVLRWVRTKWTAIFPPRKLWWLNTSPGCGGRAHRNPNNRSGE